MDGTTTPQLAPQSWSTSWPIIDPERHHSTVTRWLLRRPVRIALLLLAVWLMNGFDLLFTILAAQLGSFIELNPVAATFINGQNYAALGTYKAALVVIGTCLLWRCRYHRLSELGCWMLFFLYSGLAWRWLRYYQVWNYYCHGSGDISAECDGF